MSKENLIVVFAVILLLLSVEAMIFLSFPPGKTERFIYVQPGTGMVDQCSQKWWPDLTPDSRRN